MVSQEQAVPITAAPKAKQLVDHESKTYTTVQEGLAYILIPPEAKTSQNPTKAKSDDDVPQSVFYNPIQQFNRDLSVLAIKAFGEDLVKKRKVRSGLLKERSAGKKQRKRKRKEVEGGEDEGGVKLPRNDEGPSRGAGETTEDGPPVTEAGDEAVLAVSEGMDTNADEKGGTSSADQPKDASGPHKNHTDNANGRPAPSQTKFRILDALSATGLRALRYAQEIPFATSIVANDMDKNATKSIALNVQHNKLTPKISTNVGNAIGHMYSVAHPPAHSHGPGHINEKHDVIDLDPYGTAAPFIDAALQALNDGGMLCVTCTDSGVFASCGYSEKTFSLYGGLPIKGAHSHEGGLRLIIQSVATSAGRQGLSIEPLLSLSIDYYVRVFIRVRKSPADVKFLAGKTMLVYSCDSGCGAWTTQKLGRDTKQTSKNGNVIWKHSISQAPSADRFCEHCGSKTHVAGPMWAGPLHNSAFIENVLAEVESADPTVYATKPRLEGMLDTALDELLVNPNPLKPSSNSAIDATNQTPDLIPAVPAEAGDPHPFFFFPSLLSGIIHCIAPPEAAIKGALRHLGYVATRSHAKPGSIKTNAPWNIIWEIMREWARQRKPIKPGSLKEGSVGERIMRKARMVEPRAEVDGGETATTSSEAMGTEAVGGQEDAETPEIVIEKAAQVQDLALSSEGKVLSPPQPPPANTDPSSLTVVFDEVLGKDENVGKGKGKGKAKKLVRYQQNPRENWGPMSRAKGGG
ncbi:hypothetical protein MBLNU230_g5347t1 [Neophaeotheca triangularis]